MARPGRPGRPRGIPKTGGRKKGTPNKKTLALAEVLDQLKFDPLKKLHEVLPECEPGKVADVCVKLLDFLYPKRKAVELSGPDGEPIETKNPEVDEVMQECKKLIQDYANERVEK